MYLQKKLFEFKNLIFITNHLKIESFLSKFILKKKQKTIIEFQLKKLATVAWKMLSFKINKCFYNQ